MRPKLTILAQVLAVAMANAAYAEWKVPELAGRALFEAPDSLAPCALVRIRMGEMAGDDPGFMAFSPAGRRLPHRLVAVEGQTADVLVGLAPPTNGEYVVYFGTDASAPQDSSQPVPRDGRPVRLALHRPAGQSAPDSWEKLCYLLKAARGAVGVYAVPGFGPAAWRDVMAHPDRADSPASLPEPGGAVRRGRKEEQHWLVRYASLLECREAGRYRFAVRGTGPLFLFVDHELRAAYGPAVPSGEWVYGEVFDLDPGCHRVLLYGYSRAGPVGGRAGWERVSDAAEEKDVRAYAGEAGAGPAPLEAEGLLTRLAPLDARVESRDRALHPHFTFRRMPSYRLTDGENVFVPVRFKDASVHSAGETWTVRWTFDGEREQTTRSPVHVFAGAREHTARLTVTGADGVAASLERAVMCRPVLPRTYPLDARTAPLPAVSFPEAILEPALEIRGRLPVEGEMELCWRVTRRGGGSGEEDSERFEPAPRPRRFRLARAPAGRLDRIAWEIRHWDKTVRAGEIRFLSPPFETLPRAVEQDRLLDAQGRRIVLVARATGHGPKQPALPPDAPGAVYCLDDSLAVPSLPGLPGAARFHDALAEELRASKLSREVVYAPLAAWAERKGVYGPLLKLVEAPAALGSDAGAAVLSLGLPDLLAGIDPLVFEQHLAALVDALLWTRDCPVVLVTPPPYPRDRARAREFAVAVRRVAAARAVPVADLYTSFLCTRPGGSGYFQGQDLALTPRGHRLAARMIARALTRE